MHTASPVTAAEEPGREGLNLSVVARDVVTLGSGTLLGAIFGTLLVFLIPRLVSVEDYGYWRLFLLYAAYVGFLHLGFADGALLQWAGKPLETFHDEIAPSLRFLICEHLAIIVPAGLAAAWLLPAHLRLLGIAIFAFALIMNSVAVLQYSLQAARMFKPVAVAVAAPSASFVLLALLWELRGTPDFKNLIALYLLAWSAVLAYLWRRVRPRGWRQRGAAWRVGRRYVLLGWPIVLANTGYALVQAADRLVVSSALPIYDFAQYSFAASAMFVPVTAIAAIYRVFFPHVAAVEEERRARVYRRVSKGLLLAWSLLLPYFFALEAFVRRFLPKYVSSLPIAGVLLLGVAFLAGIQILHMSFFYLHGRQRHFLGRTIVALGASLGLALLTTLWIRSLVAVAAGQILALGLWWFFNEWALRGTSGQQWRDWLRLLGFFVWSAASYGAALRYASNDALRAAIYYVLVVTVLALVFPDEIRFAIRMFSAGRKQRLAGG